MEKQEDNLEKQHIEAVLRWSSDKEYHKVDIDNTRQYLTEEFGKEVGDKLKYNNSHRLSRYTFLPNTITIGFVHRVNVWCGDRILEFGTITYGMSECFKNGKEKSLRNGYILIPETDIIEKQ